MTPTEFGQIYQAVAEAVNAREDVDAMTARMQVAYPLIHPVDVEDVIESAIDQWARLKAAEVEET